MENSTKRKGEGDRVPKHIDDEDEDSWKSSSDSEDDRQQAVAAAVTEKWKHVYANDSKTVTPEPPIHTDHNSKKSNKSSPSNNSTVVPAIQEGITSTTKSSPEKVDNQSPTRLTAKDVESEHSDDEDQLKKSDLDDENNLIHSKPEDPTLTSPTPQFDVAKWKNSKFQKEDDDNSWSKSEDNEVSKSLSEKHDTNFRNAEDPLSDAKKIKNELSSISPYPSKNVSQKDNYDEGVLDWSISSNDSNQEKSFKKKDSQGSTRDKKAVSSVPSSRSSSTTSDDDVCNEPQDFQETKIKAMNSVSKASNNSMWSNSASGEPQTLHKKKSVNSVEDHLVDWSSEDDDNNSEKLNKTDISKKSDNFPTVINQKNNVDDVTTSSSSNPIPVTLHYTKVSDVDELDTESPFGFPKEKVPKHLTTLFMSQPAPSESAIPESSATSLNSNKQLNINDALKKTSSIKSLVDSEKDDTIFKKPTGISRLLPKKSSKYRDPVPYSTLLLNDPSKLKKQLSTSTSEINIKKSQEITNLKSSGSKSITDLTVSTTSIVTPPLFNPKTKKPFFSKLKGKLSHLTRAKSSSKESSNTSIPSFPSSHNVGSESEFINSLAEDLEDNDIIISEYDFNHQRLLKLLIDAKKILENLNEKEQETKNQEYKENDKMEKPILESGKSSPEKPAEPSSSKMSGRPFNRYCDTVNPCNPDTELVDVMLDDLRCVWNKVKGTSQNIVVDCNMFEGEVIDLRGRLDCIEKDKADAEIEMMRLQNELAALRNCLEEETQRRMNLECIVAQLREQIDCLDRDLCIVTAERDQLRACIEELQRQLDDCCRNLQALSAERDELIINCSSHQDSIKKGMGKYDSLQEALAKCCAKCDEMTMQIGCLQAEINKLKRERDELLADRDRLQKKLECEMEKWGKEKCILDNLIIALKAEISCLEKKQEESCFKFQEAIKLHHNELDCLKSQGDKFRALYEEERRAREELQKRLDDCEEQKRKNAQNPIEQALQKETVQNQNVQINQFQQQVSQMSSECDKYKMDIKRLEQERLDLNNAKQCLQVQLDSLEAEKIGIYKELQEFRDKTMITNAEKAELPVVRASKQVQYEMVQTSAPFERSVMDQGTVTDENGNQEKDLIVTNQTLRDETKRLETLVQNKDEQIVALQTAVNEVKNKSSELSQQLNLQNIQLEGLRDDLERQEAESQSVREHLDKEMMRLKQERTNLNNINQHLKLQLDSAEQDNTILSRELQEIREQQARETKNKISDMNENPHLLDESNNNLKDEITKLNHILIARNQQISALKALAAQEKEVQISHNTFTAELSAANNHLKHELSKLQKINNEREQHIISLDSLANQKRDENANEHRELKEMTIANKNLKHDTKKLKRMVNERDEHIAALQTIINEVKVKYSQLHKKYRLQSIQMEGLQADLERQESQALSEREQLQKDIIRLNQDRKTFENEKQILNEQLRNTEQEKIALKNLTAMKDRIEGEVVRLKEAISKQFVDRSDLERLRAAYEDKLSGMKSQFEAQLEMNRQLAEINEYLGKQSNDRALIDKIRDSNENLLRKELTSVSASLKLDTEKMKKLIKERDEEISSLRKAVGVLKTKYATEAQQKEELMKKVQILSSISQESLGAANVVSSNNNNTIVNGFHDFNPPS